MVTVTSDAHARGRIDLDDLDWSTRRYLPGQAYSDSKLANLLFTLELQRRLDASSSHIRAMAVHPGMARTNLLGHAHGLQKTAIGIIGKLVMQDPRDGASSTLFAASKDIPGGSFVQPSGFAHLRGVPGISRAAPAAYDRAVARQLWDHSAQLTGTGTFELGPRSGRSA